MINCSLYEDIYTGQFKKQKYKIWSIMGREGVLSYWYVVMYNSTYDATYNSKDIDLEKVDDEITNKSIDIRKLPNYTEQNSTHILFNRKEFVIPIIRNAIKNGDIVPI